MAAYWIASVVALLVVGVAIGMYLRGRLLLPGDRRRLQVHTQLLVAEQQIDALTRASIQRMRDAVRDSRWS